jgi:hypothetical protein
MPPNWSRWSDVARSAGRMVWRGFAYYGAVMACTMPHEWWPHDRPPARRIPAPPPGHPESPAAHIPPTAAEEDLWRRLGRPVRRG